MIIPIFPDLAAQLINSWKSWDVYKFSKGNHRVNKTVEPVEKSSKLE